MRIYTLFWTALVTIVLFAVTSYAFPPNHVFHLLNAVAISSAAILIASYSPSLWDAYKQRDNHVTPGHLLGFGVTLSWAGLLIRLSRWLLTSTEPSAGTEQWFYNVGLWISIASALLLVGAVALTEPKWTQTRLWVHVAAFLVLTWSLWYCDVLFPI